MKNEQLQMFNQTVKFNGNNIWVKPVCDFFGINYDKQIRRINQNILLKSHTSKKADELLFLDKRQDFCLTKQGFLTWILQINSKIVQPNLSEKLIEFQKLIIDFLFGSIQRTFNKSLNLFINCIKLFKRTFFIFT